MKERWIQGDSAAEKIIQIHEGFRKKKLADAEEYYGQRFPRYIPLFCDSNHYPKFTIEEIKGLVSEMPMSSSIDSLDVRQKLYQRIPSVAAVVYFREGGRIGVADSDQLNAFKNDIAGAIDLIGDSLPWMGEVFRSLVHEVNPIYLGESLEGHRGFSNLDLIGSIFLSQRPEPFSKTKLAISVAHELSHGVLDSFMMAMDPFEIEYRQKQIFSSIRNTLRPIYNSLHGCIAYCYMYLLANKLKKNTDSVEELQYLEGLCLKFSTGLGAGLKSFKKEMLSPMGLRVVNDLVDVLGSPK